MTVGGFFCDAYQRHGRHEFIWQETADGWEIWECSECGYRMREEVQQKVPA